MQVELVSWDDVYARCREVANQVRESGFRPDVVVAIARGGFAPARILCDFLDIHDLASIKVEHYRAGAREAGAARVVYPLNADITDRSVLLVDDVNDTGDTLAVASPYLKEQQPAELRVAVLDHKERTGFDVDYFGRRVREWHWITYPWAVIEDLSAFITRLEPLPETLEEARHSLEKAHGVRPADSTLMDVAGFLRLDWR